MKHSHKEYEQAFLLEPTKLTRLLDIIHDKLAEHAGTSIQGSFNVFLSGNRREEFTKLGDVLNLDNSRKQRIQRLTLVSSCATAGAARPEHEVEVDFGCPKPRGSSGSPLKLIVVSVRGESAGWVAGTLADVEEQVERTWLNYTAPVIALVTLVLGLLLVFASQVVSPELGVSSRSLWLNDRDLDGVQAVLEQRDTLTVEDLRAVVTRQLSNVLAARDPAPTDGTGTRRLLLLALPLMAVLALALVLAVAHYPSAVFLWGDEQQRHTAMVQRRKAMWSVIVGVTVVGVLSALLTEGLGTWLDASD